MLMYMKYGPLISIAVILAILFVLWAFWGGKNYEFIGLAPLDPETCNGYTGSIYSWGNQEVSQTNQEVSQTANQQATQQAANQEPEVSVNQTPEIPVEYQEPEDVCIPDEAPVEANSFASVPEVGQAAKPGVPYPVPEGYRVNKFPSRGERKCKETLESIYGVPFVTVRPNWLKNITGYNLELDCYNEELKIAAEYNGEQHYVWPNFTRCSFAEFQELRARDERKRELCDRNGIYLIVVPYKVAHNKIYDYIISRLPETLRNRIHEDRA